MTIDQIQITNALGDELLKGLIVVQREQTFTGEIPAYQRLPESGLEYRQIVFVSTFVYDALGWFDPHSPWMEPMVLTLVPVPHRRKFVHTVRQIRKRIRAFVAWQEEANGMWRFFGRGSGIDPDVDTTACAAMVLLEGAVGKLGQWQKHVNALNEFRSAEGLYFSYVNLARRGYTWMGPQGEPLLGFDRVVNANVLRYLAHVGEATDTLVNYLWNEAAGTDMLAGTLDYPNPLCFFHATARAWHQGDLPERDRMRRLLVPPLLEMQAEDGGFGGPLSTAMALSALLDLGHDGPALDRSAQWLLAHTEPHYGWAYEDFFVNGFGSTVWTTALAMASLARYAVKDK